MEILIVGAGIASLTLAYWLKQFGHTPTIIEKAPSIRTEGYVLDFAGTGWDVANRMGLIPALHAVEQDIDGLIYRNHQRAVAIRMKDLFKAAKMENKYMALNRRDIVAVLYEAVKQDLDIRFGTSLIAMSQADDKVSVQFSDGKSQDFALVIGGDGIHSQVRQLAFGEEAQFSHYLGYQFAIFNVPKLEIELEKYFQIYLEPNRQFGIYPSSENDWLIYLVYKNESNDIPAQEERAAFLREKFSSLDWIVPQVLDSVTDETYIYLDNIAQIQMPSWVNNRVALIGDAAYCPTLISGQGASMAMAGAYFLAQELQKNTDYHQAFAAYQAALRRDIEQIQEKARKFAPNFVPQKQWQITLISYLMRMMSLPFIRGMVGKQFRVESILEPS